MPNIVDFSLFCIQGDFLLSGSDDRSIKMYSVAPHSSEHPLRFELLRTFDGHAGAVYGLSGTRTHALVVHFVVPLGERSATQ